MSEQTESEMPMDICDNDNETNSSGSASTVLPKKQMSSSDLEKMEEAKLKAKYPIGAAPTSGHSAFLQKKLAKGQKYFDSGDYQMARQTGAGPNNYLNKAFKLPNMPAKFGTAIPTPDTVPARKTSIIQPKFQIPPSTNSSSS